MSQPEYDPSYGRTLRQAREAAGIGLRALARSLNISRTLLSNVERALKPPFMVSRSKAIADILKIDPMPLMMESARARGLDPETIQGLDDDYLSELLEAVG